MKNKKIIITSLVGVVTLLVAVVGATFAYFSIDGMSNTSSSVNVTTYTSDILTFQVGDPINIETNQTLFASGKGNATGTTFAKTTLIANNKTNTATKNYYLYLNISSNAFTYTQNTNTPEILMSITNESGTEVTSINGLSYKTVTDGKGVQVSGFDITTKTGLVPLITNRSITTTSSIEEKWNVTITFINYNLDQSANAGKGLSAKLVLQKNQKENMDTVNEVGKLLSESIIAMDGKDEFLYHHTSSLLNGTNDGSYRYAGADPDNYVCFGSDDEICPADNIYRIIGVFGDNVKLIKFDYASDNLLGSDGAYYSGTYASSERYTKKGGKLSSINRYYWTSSDNSSNVWSTSALNTTNLNKNFLNNIGSSWDSMIAEFAWKVGGNSYTYIQTSPMDIVYQKEVASPTGGTTYSDKIGLMYASDYGYAASPTYWTYKGNDTATTDYRAAINANWMYMGITEWTITRMNGSSNYAFYISNNGIISNGGVDYLMNAIRPTFYLASTVKYNGGVGTYANPIRVSL